MKMYKYITYTHILLSVFIALYWHSLHKYLQSDQQNITLSEFVTCIR